MPSLKPTNSTYDSIHRLRSQELFQVEGLLTLWLVRKTEGSEWLLPSPGFTPLPSTSASNPNPILTKEITVHVIFLRVGEGNGVPPGSDGDVERSGYA